MRNVHIQRWLQGAVMLLLTVIGGVPVMAQETVEGGEAFYIYQNDGHFDGFFYDDVKQISYSYLDTLGVEHDDYVSQEIVTADSTYRIMLMAIDSVSFVQPEIKYNPKVRFMKDEGMMSYFVSCEGMILTFKSSMPTGIRPKVDDVLACPGMEGTDGSFVGKVVSVKEEKGSLVVECDYITHYNEVFEQFITVEQVRNVQTAQGSSTRRRIAGLKAPKKVEGNYSDITLFNFNTSLEGSISVGKNMQVGVALNVGFGMTVTAAYKITLSEFYIKTVLNNQMSLGARVSLDGQFAETNSLKSLPGVGSLVSKFARIPFPASFPILYADMLPTPFIKGEAHLNVGLSTGFQVKATSFCLEIKDKWPYIDMGLNFLAPFLPYEGTIDNTFTLNAQINGTAQAGMMFPIEVGTIEWIKRACNLKAGTTVYAGPKVSGALDFNIVQKQENFNAYELLKDTRVDFSLMSIDTELKAEGKIGKFDSEVKKVSSWTFGNYPLTLFPNIAETKATVSGVNNDAVTCTYAVSGDVCAPQKLGVGLYTKESDSDIYYKKLYKSVYRNELYFLNNFNEVIGSFENIESGEYRIRPVISVFGYEFPIYSEDQVVIIEPKELLLKPEEATVDEGGGEVTVTLVTSNGESLVASTDDNWLKPQITTDGGKYRLMKVTVEENNTDALRKGTITVRQTFSSNNYVEKIFTVRQYGGLQLEPRGLNFEMAGGTKTVEVLTSMSPITVDLKDADWLDYDLDGKMLRIKAKENQGARRMATVVVSAWSDKHNGINTANLEVVQEGAVDVSLSHSELTFEVNGGSQRVNVNLGEATFNGVSISDSGKDWITVEKNDNYFIVTALPNTTALERSCYVDCSVSATTTSGTPTTVLLPVKITQKAGSATVSPSEIHFGAEGGSQQVKVDVGVFPYCGALIPSDASGWVDATVEGNGTITITAKANTAIDQRECVVTCYVAGVAAPTEAEMIKLPVKVVQSGKDLPTVTPDGDKSPFRYINFAVSRYVQYVSSNTGVNDSIMNMSPMFTFEPDNSTFKVTYGKETNHYECQGYIERSLNEEKTYASLSFDIDKKKKTVKNLKFNSTSRNVWEMAGLGLGYDTRTTNDITVSMELGDIPIKTNTSTYKECNLTASQGLKFTNFSAVLDMKGEFYKNAIGEIIYEYNGEDLTPISEHANYIPVNDPRDEAWLIISYKDGQGEPVDLEWPSEEVMESLKRGGMPIYEGSNAPTVEGTYMLSPITIVADKVNGSGDMGDTTGMVIKLSGQQGNQLDFDFYITGDNWKESAVGSMKAIIQGNGSSFSICVPEGDMSLIISGTVSDGAVNDLYIASTSDEPDKYQILKDTDGWSQTTSWSPGIDDE